MMNDQSLRRYSPFTHASLSTACLLCIVIFGAVLAAAAEPGKPVPKPSPPLPVDLSALRLGIQHLANRHRDAYRDGKRFLGELATAKRLF